MIQTIVKDVTQRIRSAKEELEAAVSTSTELDESRSLRSKNLLLQSLALLDISGDSIPSPAVKLCISSLKNLIFDLEELPRKQKEFTPTSTSADVCVSASTTLTQVREKNYRDYNKNLTMSDPKRETLETKLEEEDNELQRRYIATGEIFEEERDERVKEAKVKIEVENNSDKSYDYD